MKIKAITKYKFDGKEFESLKEVKEELHNIIGLEVLDTINRKVNLNHKDLFVLLDILCTPEVRKALLKTLNVTYEITEEDEHGNEDTETINILDVK